MREEKSKINCPTFQKQEVIIKRLTDKINMAKDIREKAKFAGELQKKVNVFLSCPDKKENINCKGCSFIANLRKKTTDLIIKANDLT